MPIEQRISRDLLGRHRRVLYLAHYLREGLAGRTLTHAAIVPRTTTDDPATHPADHPAGTRATSRKPTLERAPACIPLDERHAGRPGDKDLDGVSGQGYLVNVQIADSARKHGVLDEDILHALRNPLRVVAGSGRDLIIAADRAGRLLEVVVLDDDPTEEPVVIHAMLLRPKFRNHLR